MNLTEVLPAFTQAQRDSVHRLLAARVAYMGNRKFEEGDWAEIYCAAKGIPLRGWSNLNIDVMHGDLGVEHKMLCKDSKKPIAFWCGTSQMHPAATRAIRIADLNADANEVMRDVFQQYAELIEARTKKVQEQETATGHPDMRTGWLLWQDSLREFLYFEERMKSPDVTKLRAKWVINPAKGNRKPSKNLWVYEKSTDKKRYSITTQAGIKIQPYFDVPAPDNTNVYLFVVQGERVAGALVRVWLTAPTAAELEVIAGSLDTVSLSEVILKADFRDNVEVVKIESDTVRAITVTEEAYAKLSTSVAESSDETLFRTLISHLKAKA